MDLIRLNRVDMVLERTDLDAVLDHRWIPSPEDRILVLVNDAHTALPGLSEQLRVLSRKCHNVIAVCISRETDWKDKLRADGAAWTSDFPFRTVRLHGLEQVDADLVVAAWADFGERGLGTLNRLSGGDRSAELLRQAREGARARDGAFLGALLRARFGDRMSQHVADIIRALDVRGRNAKRKILDAFAYIVFVHDAGLDILSDQVLAAAVDLSVQDLVRVFLARMRDETVLDMHGHLLATRHREIAAAASRILVDEYGYDRPSAISELALAANTLALKNVFVPHLGIWRFQVVDHFIDEGDMVVAQRVAASLVASDEANPFFATKYAMALRRGGEIDSALEFMRRASVTVILGRDGTRSFYNEWALVALAADRPAAALCLALVAMADISGAPLDVKNGRLALQTVDASLQAKGHPALALASRSGRPTFQPEAELKALRLVLSDTEFELPSTVPAVGVLEFVSLRVLGQRNRLSFAEAKG